MYVPSCTMWTMYMAIAISIYVCALKHLQRSVEEKLLPAELDFISKITRWSLSNTCSPIPPLKRQFSHQKRFEFDFISIHVRWLQESARVQDFQPNHTLENCPGREYVMCVLNLLGHIEHFWLKKVRFLQQNHTKPVFSRTKPVFRKFNKNLVFENP